MAFNVLVVDDSAAMRSMIIKTLRLSGIPLGEIHQASNGREGLSVLEENWIDIALVDINMPIMDGEAMINQLRTQEDTEHLAIVVVSTESSETRIASLRDKCVGFVHKPFKPEDLRSQLIHITGVNHESINGDGAVSSGGFDF
jgi:two-component system chemotaxis response regulator CheY